MHGLIADRRLMIVRPYPSSGGATHRFFTQRQSPSLATIEASEPVAITKDNGEGKTLIKLSSSLVPNEHVCIDVHPSSVKSLPVRYSAGLWSDTVEVADVGDEAAAFVAKVVAKDDASFGDVRVVSILDCSVRKVNKLYCPDAARVGLWGSLPQGGLTDGFPVSTHLSFQTRGIMLGNLKIFILPHFVLQQILVATQASLDELNMRLAKVSGWDSSCTSTFVTYGPVIRFLTSWQRGKSELPMSRFRPNIVIDNASKPFDEDNWKAIQIGKGKDSVILHIAKGCPRCKQSCTDQLTGERGEEPVGTLSEFRALGTDKADVYFAQNAVMNGTSQCYKGKIRVGDPVTILTRGPPVWDSETVQAE